VEAVFKTLASGEAAVREPGGCAQDAGFRGGGWLLENLEAVVRRLVSGKAAVLHTDVVADSSSVTVDVSDRGLWPRSFLEKGALCSHSILHKWMILPREMKLTDI